MLVSVTNPNGTQVVGVELPLSSTGNFETSFVSGVSKTWINGTYTITSTCCNLSDKTTFDWIPVPVPPQPNVIIKILCTVFSTVYNIIFLLCIFLMIFGAVMYSLSTVMPGSHKNQFQNYGIGMLIGATVAMLLAVIAPYLLRAIAGNALPIASCAARAI